MKEYLKFRTYFYKSGRQEAFHKLLGVKHENGLTKKELEQSRKELDDRIADKISIL